MDVKYPEITVTLVGTNGNAFSVMGHVIAGLRRGKVPKEAIEEFQKEAMSGDYDNLLQTAMRWVNVD